MQVQCFEVRAKFRQNFVYFCTSLKDKTSDSVLKKSSNHEGPRLNLPVVLSKTGNVDKCKTVHIMKKLKKRGQRVNTTFSGGIVSSFG